MHLLTDFADQLQAGIVILHHDVEQHDRHVVALPQNRCGLSPGIGTQDLNAATLEPDIGQHHTADRMHALIVIHDQNAPRRPDGLADILHRRVVEQKVEFGISRAPRTGAGKDLSVTRSRYHCGMRSGIVTVKFVPRPGTEWQSMRPRKVSLTMLKTMCRPSPVPPAPRLVVKNGS